MLNIAKFRSCYNKLSNLSAFYPGIKSNKQFSDVSPNPPLSVQKNEEFQTATIVLQHKPVNTLNLDVVQQLTAAIKDLEDKKFQGVIITSKFPPIFSGGLDIMEMYNAKQERFELFWKSLQELWKTLYKTPLITIAALNGHTAAGGCMLALSCDYRVMLNSKIAIGFNETALGLSVPPWFRDLLINVIGTRRAEKAFFLGTLFRPKEALALNIVDELASDNKELEIKVNEQMLEWLKIPRFAREALKMEVRSPLIEKLESYQDEDLKKTTEYILSDHVQDSLFKYMELLKTKKPN